MGPLDGLQDFDLIFYSQKKIRLKENCRCRVQVVINRNISDTPKSHNTPIGSTGDKQPEATSLTNENFTFSNQAQPSPQFNGLDSDRLLQSPVESHFANTPVDTSERSSPANGFVSKDSTDLLNKELDQLEISKDDGLSAPIKPFLVRSVASIDSLLSPMDENISMFSIPTEFARKAVNENGEAFGVRSEDNSGGEVSEILWLPT